MKLSPYFSALPNVAATLVEYGADALVLFNRFLQPDLDVMNLEVVPMRRLTDSEDSHLPCRWVAILYERIKASMAASGGIHTPTDVAKLLLAGADVTMVCSSLLINGIGHLAKLQEGLAAIMQEIGYDSVTQMKGALSQRHCAEPAAFERANYMKALTEIGAWGVATLE